MARLQPPWLRLTFTSPQMRDPAVGGGKWRIPTSLPEPRADGPCSQQVRGSRRNGNGHSIHQRGVRTLSVRRLSLELRTIPWNSSIWLDDLKTAAYSLHLFLCPDVLHCFVMIMRACVLYCVNGSCCGYDAIQRGSLSADKISPSNFRSATFSRLRLRG